ncbi:MAG TPA: transcription termination/antitermination protein NusA [Candidatus Latescibacteria bacterium]|nr:transcription termination/antitermination protein NusA [Candidatus Latescibacterota bacterium]
MNYEVLEALRQIAQEKNVNRDLVLETLEIGLISAAKKRFNTGDNVEVIVDTESGSISVFVEKDVVADGKLEDEGLEIELTDALDITSEAKVGEKIKKELPFSDFGRNAIQTAKQILVQRVREAERERVYEDYQGRIGEIISGTVQQISRGDVLINIGRIEAIVPLKEQIRKERYRQGDPIRAILVNVLKTSKGPQVVLSRTHPNLLIKLFHLEVPEIYDGVIEIKAVAREPGERAKIAVHSNDQRIDPVGACVGMKGSRVQAVVRELSNERIDIVPWTEDEAFFLSRALSPAQVKRVVVDRRSKLMAAIVDDDQLSLAIGKSGQNARLASQLSGWKVDILTDTRFAEIQEEKAATRISLSELSGVGKVMQERLVEYGLGSANDISESTLERLLAVPGVGEATAEKILDASKEMVDVKVSAYREEVRIRKEAEEAAKAEEEAKKAAEEAAAKAAAAEAVAAEAAAKAEAEAAEAAAQADLATTDEMQAPAEAIVEDGEGSVAEEAGADETPSVVTVVPGNGEPFEPSESTGSAVETSAESAETAQEEVGSSSEAAPEESTTEASIDASPDSESKEASVEESEGNK